MESTEICCIKGCEKVVYSLGLCTKHYRRNRLYGSPAVLKSSSGVFRGMSAVDRFSRQMKKSDSGCWDWISSVDKDGYGMFRGKVGDIGYDRAHRFSFALHKGEPGAFMVCHSCDNPRCVCPEHLFLGTGKDNQQDKWKKGRGRVAFGAKAGKALLTERQAAAILRDPRPYTEIAAHYKIAASTVGSIKQRISWRHLKLKEKE